MEKKHDIGDICSKIKQVLESPEAKLISSGVIEIVGMNNPLLKMACEVVGNVVSEYNAFKLNWLINGLASGFNLETRLNELYTYVNSSADKAISVANLFKQTVNAECPKVCVIYGLILASHLEKKTCFTYEETIVCKALENATDYDLINFEKIMNDFLKTTSDGKKVVFPEECSDSASLIITCDWCVYNRIFASRTFEWGEIEDDCLDMSTNYYEATPASILLEYITKAKQIWDYK